MSHNLSPETAHEFGLDDGDFLAALDEFNREVAEQAKATYREDLRIFGLDVLNLLDRYGALNDGKGQAYFAIEQPAEDNLDEFFGGTYKEVVIEATSKPAGSWVATTLPTIRIVTNEAVRRGQDPEWLTAYFIATHGGQCSYTLGAVQRGEESARKNPSAQLLWLRGPEGQEGEGVAIIDLPGMVDAPRLRGIPLDSASGGEHEFPLGKWDVHEDVTAALSYGRQILTGIAQTPPHLTT